MPSCHLFQGPLPLNAFRPSGCTSRQPLLFPLFSFQGLNILFYFFRLKVLFILIPSLAHHFLFCHFFYLNFIFNCRMVALHIELVSATHQHESAKGRQQSLSVPTASQLSRLSQSPALSFLGYRATSHWLSPLHMVMCMFQCYSLKRHITHVDRRCHDTLLERYN